MKVFVDTNYFLRFLLEDNLPQYKKARELFLKASDGKIKLVTTGVVIFELYWVLAKYYKKTKKEVIFALKEILNFVFLEIEHKDLLKESIYFYEKFNLDLEDCYAMAYVIQNNIKNLKTFDIKLSKKFSEITQRAKL